MVNQTNMNLKFTEAQSNPSPKLVAHITNLLTIQMKVMEEKMNKQGSEAGGVLDSSPGLETNNVLNGMETDAEELESRSEEVLHSEGEGKFRSKTKIEFGNVDNASSSVEIRNYIEDSTFLAYQEGKPFVAGDQFLSHDMSFQVNRASNVEVKDFISLDQNFNAEFQQFTSYRFKILDVFPVLFSSRITPICVVSSTLDSARILFDRGKDIEAVNRYSYRTGVTSKFEIDINSVNELVLLTWYQLNFVFTNSVLFEIVEYGDSCYGMKLFVNMSQRNNITSQGFDRMLFDRGKRIGVLRSGNSVYKLIQGLGYRSVLLFEFSKVFLCVKNGDSHNSCKLVVIMWQQVIEWRGIGNCSGFVPSSMGCGGVVWCVGWKEFLVRVVGINQMLPVDVDDGVNIIHGLLGGFCSSFTRPGGAVPKCSFMVTHICSLLEVKRVLYEASNTKTLQLRFGVLTNWGTRDVKSLEICVVGLITILECAGYCKLRSSEYQPNKFDKGKCLLVCMMGIKNSNMIGFLYIRPFQWCLPCHSRALSMFIPGKKHHRGWGFINGEWESRVQSQEIVGAGVIQVL